MCKIPYDFLPFVINSMFFCIFWMICSQVLKIYKIKTSTNIHFFIYPTCSSKISTFGSECASIIHNRTSAIPNCWWWWWFLMTVNFYDDDFWWWWFLMMMGFYDSDFWRWWFLMMTIFDDDCWWWWFLMMMIDDDDDDDGFWGWWFCMMMIFEFGDFRGIIAVLILVWSFTWALRSLSVFC